MELKQPMWELLLKRYWQVAMLKGSPENTPYSPLLTIIAALAFFFIIFCQWYFSNLKQQFDLGQSLLAGFTLVCSYFLFTFLLLKLSRKAFRFAQVVTSLLLAHTIVHLFAFPLLLLAPILISSHLNAALALLLAIIYLSLTLVLTIWQFLITMHIYKLALEVDYITAFLATVGLLACNILTVSFWQ